MKIRDVMTTDIRTAEMDTTLEEIATIMRDEDVGAVPVLEEEELCGIVTDRDIVVRCIAEGLNPTETTAEEILSEDVRTVSPESETEEAARIMADHQIRRLPVVQKGKLVGMVSIGDLAVKSDADDESIGRTLEEVSEGVKASGEDAKRAKSTAARQQPGSATQMTERNASVRGPKSSGVTGGGRQEAIKTEGGRRGRSTRGRIEAERGNVSRAVNTGSRQQGIANRSAKEEDQRQKRVVGIDEKPSRGQRRKAS